MIPKKGDLTYSEGGTTKCLLLWKTYETYNHPNSRLATEEDKISMGLVSVKSVECFTGRAINELQTLNGCVIKDSIFDASAPAPHIWQVGQYALYKGEIYRVTFTLTWLMAMTKNGRVYLDSIPMADCTPVPEPKRPELAISYTIRNDGQICHCSGFCRPLEKWIAFSPGYKEFEDLRDWRELTGRMV